MNRNKIHVMLCTPGRHCTEYKTITGRVIDGDERYYYTVGSDVSVKRARELAPIMMYHQKNKTKQVVI